MWYLIVYLACAVWVFFDASKRKNDRLLWSLSTAVVGPIALPIYLARRNLREGETREGGTAWNALKYFAVLWTLTMGAAGIVELLNAGSVAEQTGAAVGIALGLSLTVGLWISVLVGALALGLFLKQDGAVQEGPTGRLAQTSPTPDSLGWLAQALADARFTRRPLGKAVIFGVPLIAMLGVGLAVCIGGRGSTSNNMDESVHFPSPAWLSCKRYVRDEVTDPSSPMFPSNPTAVSEQESGTWVLSSHYTLMDAEGAWSRTTFQCRVSLDDDGAWQLISLTFKE